MFPWSGWPNYWLRVARLFLLFRGWAVGCHFMFQCCLRVSCLVSTKVMFLFFPRSVSSVSCFVLASNSALVSVPLPALVCFPPLWSSAPPWCASPVHNYPQLTCVFSPHAPCQHLCQIVFAVIASALAFSLVFLCVWPCFLNLTLPMSCSFCMLAVLTGWIVLGLILNWY